MSLNKFNTLKIFTIILGIIGFVSFGALFILFFVILRPNNGYFTGESGPWIPLISVFGILSSLINSLSNLFLICGAFKKNLEYIEIWRCLNTTFTSISLLFLLLMVQFYSSFKFAYIIIIVYVLYVVSVYSVVHVFCSELEKSLNLHERLIDVD